MPPLTLSEARKHVVAEACIPMGGAATWHPRDGLRTHPALDVAARYVVLNAGARIIATGDDNGLTVDEERRLLDEARASTERPPIAEIVASVDDLFGNEPMPPRQSTFRR